ncbi:siderophore ABC transporter substrate-binding protein [Thioclava sp. GXIMD4216]|uniref:Siderophore ABC transporter substrate-binding protein n=1 Tax=Thioclava litoralis TaxID=3076557 RepID=A0ABZ1E1C6_9RHOB|nr:siderophore ABC transporter substrate-binding protein [Thioclava sp. FTW29]
MTFTKSLSVLGLALPLALAPLAQAFAADVSVETARGEATVAAKPKTVAVFDMAAMDTLDALGVTPAGRPDKTYLKRLSHLQSATPVGTLFEPDLEALAGLNPDLIIVGGRSSTKYDEVAQVAPTIDMTIGTDIVNESRARLKAYGEIFGLQDKAKALDAALETKLEKVQADAKGQGDALVVMTNGPKISAFGPGSRFGWIHQAIGMAPAAKDLSVAPHGDAISFEFIAETNPEWIFVVDRGQAIGADEQKASDTLDNPLVAQTSAAKEGHIVYLNASDAYIAGGGYQAMMEMLTEVDKAFEASSAKTSAN